MSIDIPTLRPKLQAALGDQLALGDLLGEGGFAAVFRAHDPFLERDVAIKVLDPSLAVDGAREEQFLHEARTIAAAEHPHIVPLYSAESKGGLLYLVMRLVPGQSLQDRIAQGKLPAPEAARIAFECAQALAAAHAVGVVHRDIKPANILLDANGNATVTDFGIALVTSRPSRDLLGSTTGTPHYMSPEQSLGEQVDGRSDVYALGVVLYEMLTGTCPFPGRNATEVIAKHISAPIPKVSEHTPQTPVALVRLVERMLAKDPADRPSAAELVKELKAASAPDALLTPAQVRRRRWRRRGIYLAIAAVSAGIVMVIVVRIAIQMMTFFAGSGGGADPALLESGGAVPDSIVRLARETGLVHANERVGLVFIQAHHTFPDALLLTDSAIIRSTPKGIIRRSTEESDINLQPMKRGKSPGGLLIVKRKGAPPDTLYQDLSPREGFRLMNEFVAWQRAQKVKSSVTSQDFPSDSAVLALIKQRVDGGQSVGIVVGLLERDGRRRIVAYGDPGPGQPPLDGNSVFDIGSITKVFTAILLSEMVLDGEVKLDDPVQKFLPSSVRVPQRNGHPITLAHLAMHNSGLPRDPANVGPDPGPNSYAHFTVEQMYDFLSGYSLPRDPGAAGEYSNIGVGLLGHALSLAGGKPYEQLEQERVWTPLGLHHTAITMSPWMRAHLALGHGFGFTRAIVPNWNSPSIAAAGAVRSTANDMLDFLWANIHTDSSLLGKAMVFAQQTHLAPGASVARSLIWGRRPTATDTIFGHTGGTGGYRSHIGFLRSKGVGAVVLTDNAGPSSDDLVPHLLDASIPLAKPEWRPTLAQLFALLGLVLVFGAVMLTRRHRHQRRA